MLKWTTLPRHNQCRPLASNCAPSPRSTPRHKAAKRRRSRKSVDDKENQFTSTPVKSGDNPALPPLRDVSNLTPNELPEVAPRSGTPKPTMKKKKECLDNHTRYFKPFEAVDSHIESVLAEQCRSCKKNLFCSGPPTKKSKIESIEDLLPDRDKLALPGLILNPDTQRLFDGDGVRITPLVRKFWDLQFSKCADGNDSSYINDMSLDKIVDAILDKSATDHGRHRDSATTNTSNDGNYLCKCNNNLPLEKTVIQIDETYNERCVDVRKRPSTTTSDDDATGVSKRLKLDENYGTLRRQKCVRRRRKVDHFRKKLSELDGSIESKTIAPFWSARKQLVSCSDDDSPFTENTPLRGCYLESKTISEGARRCLGFASPKTTNDSGSFCESAIRGFHRDVGGSVDLAVRTEGDSLLLTVIRCRDLCRPNGSDKINAYVKVTSGDVADEAGDRVALQRTPVQGESSKPIFNHTFRLSANQQRVRIEIWHRDRVTKTSEFLGCMSLDVGDVSDKKTCGSYRLLPEVGGRVVGHVPIAAPEPSGELDNEMGEHNCEVDDVASLDGGVDNELRRSTNKAALSEQQKYADENLFLRYLELDPMEGPEAIPAATQRRATGNKSGRTPFTQTKRLTRPPKSGFGFSVVWTHPPRIERVERGLPADRAGVLPGDYIIFVDKHNVVTMPEIEILNLIRSYGSQLTLEVFRRNPSRNGSLPASSAGPLTCGSAMTDSNVTLAAPPPPPHRRPSTICSTNTASVQDLGRRKLHLPQVTFSTETTPNNPEDGRKRTMYQLIGKEQHYCAAMQFGVGRFVSPLAERRDLISPSEHRILFQNCDELLRITEDILDHLVHDDGEVEVGLLARVYSAKLSDVTCAYRRYCAGLKKADCVLANKLKNSGGEFVRFVQSPSIPRRRPDLTAFIHKPLEHYREVLKALMAVQSATKPKHPDYVVINRVVHEMQVSYREMTAEAGLMEPTGEGRPLLSVQDLENRLVFTKCRPFVLNKPGRHWIFGGALGRVEGRDVAQYWALLFSDILLLAKVSRDRVLFVADDPIQLAYVTDMFFSVRKKDTEFRICVDAAAKSEASSPTVHCGPDLSRTPRKNAAKKCTVALRAPTLEMKAVWQNLLQRQILQLNSGLDGSSLSSPPESPDVPITSSVVTLQSAETCSLRRQPAAAAAPDLTARNCRNDDSAKRQIESLIEHKCKQMGKGSVNGKCNAVHLERWMKGQLRDEPPADSPDEQIEVEWTAEMLRQRSEELQLIDRQGRVTNSIDSRAARAEELSDHDQSPSKSTTTDSQVTVRSSPVVPESVAVCKQCHKNCLSSVAATTRLCRPADRRTDDRIAEDWQSLVLLGLSAEPVAGFLNYDPFRSTSTAVPTPPTPDGSLVNGDDSPQTEEHPYRSLSSSALTLRRFGTVSSLERADSEERVEQNHAHSEESADEDDDDEELGIDNEGFNSATLTSWTAKAGNFVAQKMAFFERLGEECGGAFFERYLKPSVNGEDVQEEETSGGTSGEEIWGTPTSGGDMDEPPNSPDCEVNNGSAVDHDDTEIMMDELLMAPPVTGAAMRGLLPRRTLEPLIEEDFSETSSSTEYSDYDDDDDDASDSSEQGNPPTGSAADARSLDAAVREGSLAVGSSSEDVGTTADDCETGGDEPRTSDCSGDEPIRIPRSESYKHIVDAAEDTTIVRDETMLFQQFRPAASFVNIARVSRSRSVRIFEFFNVRRTERRIYEKFPDDFRLAKMFSKENVVSDSVPTCYDEKTVSLSKVKDKQVDRRFWKQLSKRRASIKVNPPA
ncbi:uncharacterized protein LOC132702642 [Cylas formicarius]|uniref:uncharacterized protein LOC132702642 n=1 Tax=Cylas formicarius TaxID=197179 RepID=UPI00295897EB|nr:uncharacterized protein LOC132702642 [Cylas formicarius]